MLLLIADPDSLRAFIKNKTKVKYGRERYKDIELQRQQTHSNKKYNPSFMNKHNSFVK